ncbi:MAG: hypothetical protein ACYDAL_11860 [Candidatus Dormibacteraceae bacterium]
MARSAFDELVEKYYMALDELLRGNPEPAQALYSHRQDAPLPIHFARSRNFGRRLPRPR